MSYTRTELSALPASEVRELAEALDIEYTTKAETIDQIVELEDVADPEPPAPEPDPQPALALSEPEPEPEPEPIPTTAPPAPANPQYPNELLVRLGQPLCRTCGAPKSTDRYGNIVCAIGNKDRSQCLFK